MSPTPARRPEGRKPHQIRPLTIETGVNLYAEGSALIKMGNTHVLCTASVEESVPEWLKGKSKGWVTAEYSMLPRSTHTRSRRDREKVSGRTQEIQRLIGRALRAAIDLPTLGERSILIDCDVLQADGGTRTASITGAYVALAIAAQKLVKTGKLTRSPMTGPVSAISIGIQKGTILTDLDYIEDSSCDVDANFVITGEGKLVEVQGTAEKDPFSADQLAQMLNAALAAAQELNRSQEGAIQATKW